MAGLYTHTTRATGTLLTAAIYNADHQNHIDNQTPQMTDDYSTDVPQMQSVVDPYPSSSESLATSLAGEVERLRYQIKAITGESQWYIDPASTLKSGVANTIPVVVKTVDYTAVKSDGVILVDASAGAVTITLPDATASDTYFLEVKKIDSSANAVTVNRAGTDTIDGLTSWVLSDQYDFIHLQSGNNTWNILEALVEKPTISDFTNAQHDHGSAAKGGAIPEAGITFNDTGHGHTGGTDGKLISVNQLGTWTTKSVNTVYQAATDIMVLFSNSAESDIRILSDGSNPPTTERARQHASAATRSFCCSPVRKNDYYKCEKVSGAGTANIQVIPLGS